MENTTEKLVEVATLLGKLTEEVKSLGGKIDNIKDDTIYKINETIGKIQTDVALITERTKDLDDKYFDNRSGKRLEMIVYGVTGIVGTEVIVWVLSLIPKH